MVTYLCISTFILIFFITSFVKSSNLQTKTCKLASTDAATRKGIKYYLILRKCLCSQKLLKGSLPGRKSWVVQHSPFSSPPSQFSNKTFHILSNKIVQEEKQDSQPNPELLGGLRAQWQPSSYCCFPWQPGSHERLNAKGTRWAMGILVYVLANLAGAEATASVQGHAEVGNQQVELPPVPPTVSPLHPSNALLPCLERPYY